MRYPLAGRIQLTAKASPAMGRPEGGERAADCEPGQAHLDGTTTTDPDLAEV